MIRGQILARFEPNGFSDRDLNLFTRFWIPTDTGFAVFDDENAETPQLDPVSFLE